MLADPANPVNPSTHRPGMARIRLILLVCFGVALGALAAVVLAVTHGLPDTRAIREATATDRVTMIYDAADKPLFPVFKEERIDVPLAKMSPDLIHAVL